MKLSPAVFSKEAKKMILTCGTSVAYILAFLHLTAKGLASTSLLMFSGLIKMSSKICLENKVKLTFPYKKLQHLKVTCAQKVLGTE